MALVFLHQVRSPPRKPKPHLTKSSSLPIGAIAIVVILLVLHIDRENNPDKLSTMQRILQLDLLGAALIIPTVVMLLLALQWGGSTYAWNNSKIIGLFCGFGGLLIIFLYSQWKLGDKATLPFRLFRDRNVSLIFLSLYSSQEISFYPRHFHISFIHAEPSSLYTRENTANNGPLGPPSPPLRPLFRIRLLRPDILPSNLLPIHQRLLSNRSRNPTPSPPHRHSPLIHRNRRPNISNRLLRPRNAHLHDPLLHRRRPNHNLQPHDPAPPMVRLPSPNRPRHRRRFPRRHPSRTNRTPTLLHPRRHSMYSILPIPRRSTLHIRRPDFIPKRSYFLA